MKNIFLILYFYAYLCIIKYYYILKVGEMTVEKEKILLLLVLQEEIFIILIHIIEIMKHIMLLLLLQHKFLI